MLLVENLVKLKAAKQEGMRLKLEDNFYLNPGRYTFCLYHINQHSVPKVFWTNIQRAKVCIIAHVTW